MKTKVIRLPKYGSMIAVVFVMTALIAVGMIANGASANAAGNGSSANHTNPSSDKASRNSSDDKRADVAKVNVTHNSSKTKKTESVSPVVPASNSRPKTSHTTAVTVPGNNGTLKIHQQGTPSGTNNTDPHICVFNGEGIGLDAGQTGYLMFEVQGKDAPKGVEAGPFAFGPANASGYFATKYFTLANGHYKATLYGKRLPTGELSDVKAKSKNFKVMCAPATPPTSTKTTPPPTTPRPTSTVPETHFGFTAFLAAAKCVQGKGTAALDIRNTGSDVVGFDVWLNGKQFGDSFTLSANEAKNLTLTLKPGSNTVIVNGPAEGSKTFTVVNNCFLPPTHTTTQAPPASHGTVPMTPLARTGINPAPWVIVGIALIFAGLAFRFLPWGRSSGKFAANRS